MVATVTLAVLAAAIPAHAPAAGKAAQAAGKAAAILVLPGQPLQQALDAARPGDRLTLAPGIHRGPILIRKAITLAGEEGAILDGGGKGSVVTVGAPAVVTGLAIRGSGRDLQALDSGVFLTESATGARIEKNQLEGNLYGVSIHGAAGAVVRENRILGMRDGRVNEAGNGVSLWNAPGAQVLENDIRFGRDGIFTNASRDNLFRGNRLRDLRFAVHYMYTNDSTVADNRSEGNIVGYAIMFSNRLKIIGNQSIGDRDNGLLLNAANDAEIRRNSIFGRPQPESRWSLNGQRPAAGDATISNAARPGPEKCVFIYNANRNLFLENRFQGCAIGIHFTAGSERNHMAGNAFIDNRNQVKYVGTRSLDWSADGRGNYWSDNPAFDLDGDGIADRPYRPNDIQDRLLWRAPLAKLLVNSPAIQILRFAQAHFPGLFPGGVIDSHPLMRAPDVTDAMANAAANGGAG